MAEQGYPPVPPAPSDARAAAPYPPGSPSGAPYPYAPYGAEPDPGAYRPAKRSRAGMWWAIGIAVLLLLVIGSCWLPFLLLSGSDGVGLADGSAIAVIRVDGVIAGTGDSYSGVITPEHFLDQLEQAEKDDRVKAIVLRVDSPGGTVAASEEISAYVRECKKPVVVSAGDVAASGAYMVSSQADEIWANEGSAVGSIGVIAEIPNVATLLDKVGVDFQVITAGKYKDAGSPYRPLTKEERALIQGEVSEAYGQFVDIVAEGRRLDRAKVQELATGQVWNGAKARELGLVDELGTYRDALDAAAVKGGIRGDYDVVTYGDDLEKVLGSIFSLSERLAPLDSLQSRDSLTRQALPK